MVPPPSLEIYLQPFCLVFSNSSGRTFPARVGFGKFAGVYKRLQRGPVRMKPTLCIGSGPFFGTGVWCQSMAAALRSAQRLHQGLAADVTKTGDSDATFRYPTVARMINMQDTMAQTNWVLTTAEECDWRHFCCGTCIQTRSKLWIGLCPNTAFVSGNCNPGQWRVRIVLCLPHSLPLTPRNQCCCWDSKNDRGGVRCVYGQHWFRGPRGEEVI